MADTDETQVLEENKVDNGVVELTEDEIFEAKVLQKYGVPSSELVKRADLPKDLTPDEKKEAEELQRQSVLKFALDNKVFTTTEHEEYLTALQADKIALLRKQYIADHPNDKEAGNKFDKIYRLTEPDELADPEGEGKLPNEDKLAARALAEKQADELIEKKFGKIKGAGQQYENYQAEQRTIKENTEIVTKAIKEIPKKYEIKTGHDTYSFSFSDEDIADAQVMVKESGLLKKKGISAKEVTANVALFLKTKRFDDIVAEVEAVAIKRTKEKMERGESGIEVVRTPAPSSVGQQVDFNKKYGLPV